MPLLRILEPEEMAGADEAAEYDAMDFGATDDLFVERAVALSRPGDCTIDIGCGNAKIPLAIASRAPASRICAVEMSREMLAVAVRHRARADASAQRMEFVRADAKLLPFAASSVDMIVSNSLIHHIPDPGFVFREIARVLKDSGSAPRILIRDLVRPGNETELRALAEKYSAGWSALQRRLYADSLHAALSLDEVRAYAADAGLQGVRVEQITDRHWSLEPTP
jgi:ubiquinone/menaquinone biosynthesis C-methylase UbiE